MFQCLYILDISPVLEEELSIFPPGVSCLFTDVSFAVQQHFKSDVLGFLKACDYFLAVGVLLHNALLVPVVSCVFSMLSAHSFNACFIISIL